MTSLATTDLVRLGLDSTYTNSEQLRVCRLLGGNFFSPVLPKDSLAAVSRAPVDAMLTVWLSFLVFAGRTCSQHANL
jgi:hypothetical protein